MFNSDINKKDSLLNRNRFSTTTLIDHKIHDPLRRRSWSNSIAYEPSQNQIDEENNIVYKILSILYGLIIFILGVAFSISRAIIPREDRQNTRYLFAIFFIYLYWASIIWILFWIFDIEYHKHKERRRTQIDQCLTSSHPNYQLANLFSKQKISSKFERDPRKSISLDNSPVSIHKLKLQKCFRKVDVQYNYDDHSTSSGLYIRVGIGIFCLGTVVHSGLSILDNFEKFSCAQRTAIIDDFSRLLFSFVQFFFIFKHSNLVIHAHQNFARIAVMHIVATNLCVWFNMVVIETKSQILEMNAYSIFPIQSLNTENVATNKSYCQQFLHNNLQTTEFIHDAYVKLKPILYPCTIEFSLMCLTLFFLIWENIGRKFSYKISNKASTKNVFMVDCHSSIKGLFFGMILFSCTVISIILYVVLRNKTKIDTIDLQSSSSIINPRIKTSYQNYSLSLSNNHSLSIASIEIVNLCLLIISLLSSIWALMKIRRLKYHKITTRFDHVLIIVSLTGIYLYSIFSAFALVNNKTSTTWIIYIKIIIVILEFLEGSIHALFIIVALRKRLDQTNQNKYPAREIITLLIVLDLSLWFEETTTTKHEANPFQLNFYQIVPWSIITAFATPLKIFFRFHASVCLAHVWENMYIPPIYESFASNDV